MADFTIIQGESRSINIDATEFGTIDAFQVEITSNNRAAVKYRYPTTTGYNALTKVNSTYTAQLTTAITSELLGLYALELTAFAGTEETGKTIHSDFMLVNQQAL